MPHLIKPWKGGHTPAQAEAIAEACVAAIVMEALQGRNTETEMERSKGLCPRDGHYPDKRARKKEAAFLRQPLFS